MNMTWTHEYDRLHCAFGIPSVFTLTHEGEIHLDVKRTRDFYKYNSHWIDKIHNKSFTNSQQHLIAIDQNTKIPQYILLSTKDSCIHPQFQLVTCQNYAEAMKELQKYKQLAFEEHVKRMEIQQKDR